MTPLELVCTVHVFKEGDKPVTLIGLADGQHLLITDAMVRIYDSEEAVRYAQPTNYMERHPLAATDDSATRPTEEGGQPREDEPPGEGEGGKADDDSKTAPTEQPNLI